MYLAIDIGGTKTFIAALDDNGVIKEQLRFPTPKEYSDFTAELANTVAKLTTKTFVAAGVGIPGKIDRRNGIGLAFGNLTWKDVPIKSDVHNVVHKPVVIENDANLAGLSESMLLREYKKVLYVTISTGIGTGIIINNKIDPELADGEGGRMLLEHNGQLKPWEEFASGKAIVRQFGKQAHEITNNNEWQTIAHNISLGLIDMIALIQPDIIVLGGSVGTYYKNYQKPLQAYLQAYETPLLNIPPIIEAARPEEAVVYGCYDLAKSVYGKKSDK